MAGLWLAPPSNVHLIVIGIQVELGILVLKHHKAVDVEVVQQGPGRTLEGFGGGWLLPSNLASMLIWLSFIHWSLAVASTQEQHMSDAIRPPPADPANWHSCLIITALNSHHFTSMARNWLTFVALRPGEECAGELLSPVIILIKICMSGQCWCEQIMGKIWMSHSLGYIIMGWGQSITI